MNVCSKCGGPIALDARFCDGCGTPLAAPPVASERLTPPELICSSCGQPLAAGVRFCAHCGQSSETGAVQAPTRVSVAPKVAGYLLLAGQGIWLVQALLSSASGDDKEMGSYLALRIAAMAAREHRTDLAQFSAQLLPVLYGLGSAGVVLLLAAGVSVAFGVLMRRSWAHKFALVWTGILLISSLAALGGGGGIGKGFDLLLTAVVLVLLIISRKQYTGEALALKRRLRWGAVALGVALVGGLVGLGVGATAGIPAPKVEGMSQQDASQVLAEYASLSVEGVEQSEQPKDLIVRQNPGAGSKLNRGGTVQVWVSSGVGNTDSSSTTEASPAVFHSEKYGFSLTMPEGWVNFNDLPQQGRPATPEGAVVSFANPETQSQFTVIEYGVVPLSLNDWVAAEVAAPGDMTLREVYREEMKVAGLPSLYVRFEEVSSDPDRLIMRSLFLKRKDGLGFTFMLSSRWSHADQDEQPFQDVTRSLEFQRGQAPPAEGRSTNSIVGQWEGTFEQYVPVKSYPMKFEISDANGRSFQGVLHWPTLRDSKTAVTGEQHGKDLVWSEDSLLQGSGVLLHGTYKAFFSGSGRIEGKCYHSQLGSGAVGSFVLRRVRE